MNVGVLNSLRFLELKTAQPFTCDFCCLQCSRGLSNTPFPTNRTAVCRSTVSQRKVARNFRRGRRNERPWGKMLPPPHMVLWWTSPPPHTVLWRTSRLHEDGRRPNPSDQGRRILAKLIWYNIRHEMTSGRMNDKTTDCSQHERIFWNGTVGKRYVGY